jgi:signal transduction histidine kinase
MKRRVGLKLKFALLFMAVAIVAFGTSLTWSSYFQHAQAESEMLEKAQILSQEMEAVWDFMEINQDRMGDFQVAGKNYKGFYCVIAAKAVSSLFTEKTDYVIHYTNQKTRKPSDAPDAFESEALRKISNDDTLGEYYGTSTDEEGKPVFRYMKPLYITKSCLECHGDPKGELDSFGFPKEGLQVGDLAGAASIVMPIDSYLANIQRNIILQTGFFTLAILLSMVCIFFVLSRWVTKPLGKLEAAVEQVEDGDFDIELDSIVSNDEIMDLAQHINSMSNQLNHLYSGLEQEVTMRTGQLFEANDKLKQQQVQLEVINLQLQEENQFQSDFFAMMSHELKTPLTAICAFIEIWESEFAAVDERQKNLIRDIKANSQILLSTVNNILDMARLEIGKTELIFEPVDIIDIVQSVESTVESLIKKKELMFSIEVSPDAPIITADWEKLRRIVENLVSNAIKFTQRGGTIVVRVTYNEPEDQIVLAVEDSGIGIAQDDIPKIFERYTQKDKSAYRRYKGSGLGLAVVKELVELHKGSIKVSSECKKGSTFSVSIPVGDKTWEGLE